MSAILEVVQGPGGVPIVQINVPGAAPRSMDMRRKITMAKTDPVYRCEWGTGYKGASKAKPIVEDHDIDYFTDSNHYHEGDRRRIARLGVGDYLNLSQFPAGLELYHLVTRIA